MFTITTFRYVALAEATSFLILLVAMIFKYGLDAPEGVQVMGPVHGLLFLAYVGIALGVRLLGRAGWSPLETLGVLVGAVLPLGGFVVDRWMARTGQLKTA